MRLLPFRFEENTLWLLDQRRLPFEEVWVACRNAQETAQAIRAMVVRGAPAIGVTAAYGMVLAHLSGEPPAEADAALRQSRPTAVNLFYALERMKPHWGSLAASLQEAQAIWAEVESTEKAIGQHGAQVLRGQVLTHCNTGPLATGGYGTALGAIVEAYHQGRVRHVWVDETRPYLQGARLTAYELQKAGVPATLICDNMAAHLMAAKQVDAVIVGADRMALNGDFANKIGTYALAVLARHHGIPFYPALPLSTVDPRLETGAQIPIEERPAEEVTTLRGQPIAPPGFPAAHPAFDITPHPLITGIVTEKGVLYPPFDEALRRALGL
ncbi:MAG: S-methyl-5-thioribose-1-phosphate isomerase [Meiothermus sp.]|uniref:S-methyl-5-thioribose-1-phosphate isomerase n=1 Tax=Meiothermus sp. TaxID=1955249 RepID=UPI0025EF491E|nr:S-methyl-5-thioribose-1-phosphate isomerase [Meiothermus sp.]MCS7058494.1 S-methyl-5-thioribose-1-phosphate isomerase [Meiothermus sp.]MCS7195308.1 S-methyl-5-thioribose-1-phosphate isomerase [Meiothermus sp.]MCX7741008.1 S-methyl-5-thioribose-1-phosphate isomerase [Meiothermus sp.]MDW8091653.1 S-methyl-5-thioribose-1-phosphate isomerase [Meiothermus sp.]MDW8480968.1 S-methyl-5-thioribose-1-phosphate isomerase [Meiothermus sp.]